MSLFKHLVPLALALSALTSYAAVPTDTPAKQVVSVHQIEANGNSALTAKAGPLVNSTAGFGMTQQVTPIRNPEKVGSIPVFTYPAGSTESGIMAAAKSYFQTEGPALAAKMSGWMQANGVSFAWFTYEQKIVVSMPKGNPNATGGWMYVLKAALEESASFNDYAPSTGYQQDAATEERWLVWTMSTDSSGRPMFGQPRVIAPQPKTLYVLYTPLKVDPKIPQEWRYAQNPGTLFVQTRDSNFDIIPGTDELIQVYGAYDEPIESTARRGAPSTAGAPFNADENLDKLIKEKVRSLMDDRGASNAVVDYVRKVQPHYVETSAGTLVAEGNLAISDRILTYNCGTASYRNVGVFSVRLSSTVSRYFVTNDGKYSVIAESTKKDKVLTSKDYDVTVSAVHPTDLPKIAELVIDPVDPGAEDLLSLKDDLPPLTPEPAKVVVNGVSRYVRVLGNVGPIISGLSAHLFLGCNADAGTIDFSAGWGPAEGYGVGPWNTQVNGYTQGTQFKMYPAPPMPAYNDIATSAPVPEGSCGGSAYFNGVQSITLNWGEGCNSLLYGTPFLDPKSGKTVYANNGLGSMFPQVCPANAPRGGVKAVTPDLTDYTGCLYGYKTGFQLAAADMATKGIPDTLTCEDSRDSLVFITKTNTALIPPPDTPPAADAPSGQPGAAPPVPLDPANDIYTSMICVSQRTVPTWVFNF